LGLELGFSNLDPNPNPKTQGNQVPNPNQTQKYLGLKKIRKNILITVS